jgi:hypothetical protein
LRRGDDLHQDERTCNVRANLQQVAPPPRSQVRSEHRLTSKHGEAETNHDKDRLTGLPREVRGTEAGKSGHSSLGDAQELGLKRVKPEGDNDWGQLKAGVNERRAKSGKEVASD